ncbi:MAG: hypothetical protein GY827_00910 [Cytophagales bacterium]|nr:hypothetical protein [Cytophagales bacterium]
MEPSFSYTATEGEECCDNCEINNGEPVTYIEHKGTPSLELGLSAYPGAFKKKKNYDKYILTFEATFSAGVELNGEGTGEVSGKETECEEENCIAISANVDISGTLGTKAQFAASLADCHENNSEDCVKIIEVSGGGDAKVTLSSGASFSEIANCSKSCEQFSVTVGSVSVSASFSYKVKILNIISYEDSIGFDEDIFDGFDFPFGDCE